MLRSTKPIIESSDRGTIEKKKSLPEGIDKKESHYAQTLAENPEVVEEIKSRAREEGTIPTRHDVIKEVEKRKKAEQDNLKAGDKEPGKGTIFNKVNENIFPGCIIEERRKGSPFGGTSLISCSWPGRFLSHPNRFFQGLNTVIIQTLPGL